MVGQRKGGKGEMTGISGSGERMALWLSISFLSCRGGRETPRGTCAGVKTRSPQRGANKEEIRPVDPQGTHCLFVTLLPHQLSCETPPVNVPKHTRFQMWQQPTQDQLALNKTREGRWGGGAHT